jgi:hypothetical protein
MPQGVAAVLWNEQKDIQLFLTILAVQKVNVDYNAVAAAFGKFFFPRGFELSILPFCSNKFSPNPRNLLVRQQRAFSISTPLTLPGPNVPGSCIQSRMKALRKKASELGITVPETTPKKSNNKRGGPATPTSAKKAKGKNGEMSSFQTAANNEDDDEETNGGAGKGKGGFKEEQPTTPPALSVSSDDENTPTTKTAGKRKISTPRKTPSRKSVKRMDKRTTPTTGGTNSSMKKEEVDVENEGFVKREGEVKQEEEEEEGNDEVEAVAGI